MFKCLSSIIILILYTSIIKAQDKPDIKFNHVLAADFDISKLKVDTTFGAVIIADVGSSSFVGNKKGGFSLVFKRERRIRIIDKRGFSLSTVDIPLLKLRESDREENLDDLKASTYNLENGIVVETKLNKDAIFKEVKDKEHVVKKFSMPAVKEGSIIEYSYTINSDFLFNLHSWNFQGEFPRVWSEYNLDLPRFYEYVFLIQGYNNFDVKTSAIKKETYSFFRPSTIPNVPGETYTINSTSTVNRWVIKNVPVLKEEKYTSSLENFISKINFQMSGIQFPEEPHKDILATWDKVCEGLLNNEYFGERLDEPNLWMNDDKDFRMTYNVDRLTEAKNIYAYLQNNFKSLGINSYELSKPLKETFRTRSGYVADLNILLTALLKHENITASPVLLSTRSNGYTNETYPLLDRFNYVICQVVINDTTYYLDASKPYLGFNKLSGDCYNGGARVISKVSEPINFYADSLKEKKITTVMLFNDDKKPGAWNGILTTQFGYHESCNLRAGFLQNAKDGFEKMLKGIYTGDFSIDDIKYEDEKDYEQPMSMSHSIKISGDDKAAIIYFNPMMKEGYQVNFFTSADRKYPVEMPYKMDETYIFQMDIPVGYVIDELPKPVRVSLNGGEGFFEYLIEKTDKQINLRTRIKLQKATFQPADYALLRNFFDYIVKKHAEQIVFKKK